MFGLRRNPPTEPLPLLSTCDAPLAPFEAARSRYTCRLEDVVLATVAGGLRQLAVRRGELPHEVVTHVPDGVLTLPAQLSRPTGRLRHVHAANSALAHGARGPRRYELAVAPSLRAAPRRAPFVIAHRTEADRVSFRVYAALARQPELRELPVALEAAVHELDGVATAPPRVVAA